MPTINYRRDIMPVIQGTVEAVYHNKVNTQWGEKQTEKFKINGQYFSGGFKKWGANKGDEVELNYDTNSKGYNDIKAMIVTAKGEQSMADNSVGTTVRGSKGRSFPVDPLAPERTINRQNALTNAVNFCTSFATEETPVTTVDVISVAREFEAYTCGDIDKEEAIKMLKEVS